MKTLVFLVAFLESFASLGQKPPSITFGGIESGVISKDQLLLNEGIRFSNDTSENIECLMVVEFSFRIVKVDGDTIEILTNNCPERVNKRREERFLRRFDQGKTTRDPFRKSNCNGIDRFNHDQLKAIREMKSGEVILIDRVKTRASSCACLNRWWSAKLKYTVE